MNSKLYATFLTPFQQKSQTGGYELSKCEKISTTVHFVLWWQKSKEKHMLLVNL